MDEYMGTNQPVMKKSKRGVRNYDCYTRNVIKQFRLKGLEYKTVKGKQVEAAKV